MAEVLATLHHFLRALRKSASERIAVAAPGGEALWTGRDTGRSERTSQAAGLTPSITMDKYINRDARRVGADLQQWPSR